MRERGERREERSRFVFDLGPLKKILAALATSRLSKLINHQHQQPPTTVRSMTTESAVGGRALVPELYTTGHFQEL